jgi:GT2 family glycosyltransferase
LGSIKSNLADSCEVIVVDNASTDGSADSARISGARVLCLEANTGFASAANIGLLAAERHVVVVMNPDVVLTPLALEALKATTESQANVLVSPLQETPSLGILGMQAQMSRLLLIRSVLENAGASSRVCGVIHALDRRLSAGRPGWLLGNCIAAARDNWYANGGFDISYFLYMEDVDLSDRWRNAGGSLAIVDEVVRHDMGSGSSIPNAQRVRALNEARVEYGRRKYGERFSRLLLRLAS